MIINGSTRENGNTDRIIRHFVRGVREAGGQAAQIKLRDKNIGQCVGCCECRGRGRCGSDDDMTGLRRRIERSGLLVFASPVYWCEVTGLLKTFIDRLYFYHHPGNAALVAGKKSLVVLTMGEADNIDYESEVVLEFFRRVFSSLKIQWLDTLLFPALMEKGDLIKKPEFSRIAFEAGKKYGKPGRGQRRYRNK